MWENEDIEAMIICTGPQARQSLVCEALEAGYHVFVPKPPAETLADSDRDSRSRESHKQSRDGELSTSI